MRRQFVRNFVRCPSVVRSNSLLRFVRHPGSPGRPITRVRHALFGRRVALLLWNGLAGRVETLVSVPRCPSTAYTARPSQVLGGARITPSIVRATAARNRKRPTAPRPFLRYSPTFAKNPFRRLASCGYLVSVHARPFYDYPETSFVRDGETTLATDALRRNDRADIRR